MLFDLSPYQVAGNVGTLQWQLVGAPYGVTIDAVSGTVTVEEGVAIQSTTGIFVTVTNPVGASKRPLVFTVSSYEAPNLLSLTSTISADVTNASATINLAASLSGQVVSPYLVWSIIGAVPFGVLLDPQSGVLTLALP